MEEFGFKLKLKNKTCFIANSKNNIGIDLIKLFVNEGAVIFCNATPDNLSKEQLKNINQLDFNILDRKSLQNTFSQIKTTFGKIDILVNNNNAFDDSKYDTQTDEQWDYIIENNLNALFRICQESLIFIKDSGRIINFSSISGEFGGEFSPAYVAASKGIMAFTHNLARFLSDRSITVNCISPGYVQNNEADQTIFNAKSKSVTRPLLEESLGKIDNISQLALFLASDECSFITAQTISINGGAWVR
tara:strand:- start:2949 stop:3689 length:741 start_codon:yes stop_codon:yes gene_type:complete